MRYATLVVEGSAVHPVARLLAESGVRRESIIHFDVLDDGTILVVGRLRGDLDRVRDLLTGRPDVLGYDIPRERDGIVYVHLRATADVERLLSVPRKHEVFFETPIERAGPTGLRLTVIGETSAAVGRAISDFPDSLDFSLSRTGDYPRDAGDLSVLLTERQRDVLAVAVRAGYYESPRKTTHRGIADELGLAAGTVSEHLRKTEQRVFTALVE